VHLQHILIHPSSLVTPIELHSFLNFYYMHLFSLTICSCVDGCNYAQNIILSLIFVSVFDFTAKVEHGPLYHHHPEFDFRQLDCSINVISIKVAESDVPYPINIYDTVLARDQYDYRCVYLFKRGRDNPQLISSPVCIYSGN
jgi:hypothetical protein